MLFISNIVLHLVPYTDSHMSETELWTRRIILMIESDFYISKEIDIRFEHVFQESNEQDFF